LDESFDQLSISIEEATGNSYTERKGGLCKQALNNTRLSSVAKRLMWEISDNQ
jgi:hypothetical protein